MSHVHGAGDAPASSNTTSVQRATGAADTDNNAADFTTGAPTPGAAPGGDNGGGTNPRPRLGFGGSEVKVTQGAVAQTWRGACAQRAFRV